VHALVTGASGFLGGRLVELLLDRGVPVLVLARASSVVPERAGVQVVRASLNSGEFEKPGKYGEPRELRGAAGALLAGMLKPVTHVFHCAGCSTDWAPWALYREANIDAVAGILELAKTRMPGLVRFVHVSTTDVYGYPVVAGDETLAHVDTGLPYNQTKLRGEALVWEAARGGLPVTVLRPASIYGPGGTAFVTDIVTLLRQRLMLLVDGGRAPGGFVYVDDVCRAMLLAAESPAALGEAYNVSSVDGTDWRRYTAALAGALGLPRPWLQMPFGAAMALAAVAELPHKAGLPGKPLLTRHATYLLARDQEYSVVKAREQLGWVPLVGLAEGVQRSVRSLAG
jgi:nucleoside-diphosphate-sugar epimerase